MVYHSPGSSGSYNNKVYTLEAAPEVINLDRPLQVIPQFIPKSYTQSGYSTEYSIPQHKDYFVAEPFLKDSRPFVRFIGSAEDVKHYVSDIFEKMTGKELPDNIIINVVDEEALKEHHTNLGGVWNPAVQGFSMNNRGFGNNLVIVKKNDLDKLLITIGHEIGHLMSMPLKSKVEEEAKAFAFEMEWIKTIHEHNSAGLKKSINLDPRPAKNGLHNIAFNFVLDHMKAGKQAAEVFAALVNREIKMGADEDGMWM
jgi:hypothetical protein